MTPLELLSEKEYAFYEKLDSNSLKELTLEEYDYLKNIANNYIYDIQSIIQNNDRKILFQKILYKFSRETNDSLSFFIPISPCRGNSKINFNKLSEILTFIILVIDPKFEIANKYLSFVEQTNSNAKALLMYKQYAKAYKYLFDSKLLQAELILMQKELELKESKNNTEKRTIIG